MRHTTAAVVACCCPAPFRIGGRIMDILYWDIDGTLVNTGMAGMHAIQEVFHELQGDDQAVPKIAAGGRTDNYICQQLLYQARGVMPTDEEVNHFCRNYEQNRN